MVKTHLALELNLVVTYTGNVANTDMSNVLVLASIIRFAKKIWLFANLAFYDPANIVVIPQFSSSKTAQYRSHTFAMALLTQTALGSTWIFLIQAQSLLMNVYLII